MIDPIRQFAKGEEVDLSFPALATSALANSGVLGWQWDALQRLNARIDTQESIDHPTTTPGGR